MAVDDNKANMDAQHRVIGNVKKPAIVASNPEIITRATLAMVMFEILAYLRTTKQLQMVVKTKRDKTRNTP